MKITMLAAVLVTGTLTCVGSPRAAFAESPISNAFLANVAANVDFLDRSSRVALDHASTAGMRAFARGEALEATKVASVLGIAPAPGAEADADGVATGRSVAEEGPRATGPGTGLAAMPAANGRAPLGRADLADLQTVSGPAFDDLYWQKQLDALSQIESDYRTYIKNGDDPALIAIARNELPKVMHRLEALTRI